VTLLSSLALASGANAVTVPTVTVPQTSPPPVLQQVLPKPPSTPAVPSPSGGGGSPVPTPSLPAVPGTGGGGGNGSGSGSGSTAPSGGGGASGGGSHSSQPSTGHGLRAAKRLSSCLSSISAFERRVLILRAGLNGRHALAGRDGAPASHLDGTGRRG
jgi:hypothetical protein